MSEEPSRTLNWLRLSLTPGVGPITGERLLERFGEPEAIFAAELAELLRVKGVSEPIARAVLDAKLIEEARRELERAEARGVKIAAKGDPGYPGLLAGVPGSPLLLYLKGELTPADDVAVAVVGCRTPDPYGESLATSIGAGFAARGVTVVSGLARGVDGIAQTAALKAGGRSVAVLGSGVDVVYPPEHRKLYDAVVAAGAVISEAPLGTEPTAGAFPRRNRIISGMALGVVMVQAMTEKSGALITARLAADQGREVFAVPGAVGSRSGRIGNALIKKGAKLIETADDALLHLLPLEQATALGLGEAAAGAEAEKPGRGVFLPEDQARIFALTPAPHEGTIELDGLARQAQRPVQEVAAILLELELAGLVRALPGARFVRMG